jgi:predicted nucleic acid-binding protein
MSAVRIVDTSVFCNIIAVPGRCQEKAETLERLEMYIDQDDRLLLPMAAVYETGNHIAQASRDRRRTAQRFAEKVSDALEGRSPFEPTQIHEAEEVKSWLDTFPEYADKGIGIGDRSIIAVWEQLCVQAPSRRVVIWTYDDDLAGYDRGPSL